MINVGLYYNVKIGHEKEFEDTFNKVISSLKEMKIGFVDGKLYRAVQTSNANTTEYMIYSVWDGADAFRKFTTSEAFKNTTHYGNTIIEGKPFHRIFGDVQE